MTLFDKREDAFEAKYAHDAEMQFKARARRNKLLGMWAAEQLGREDKAAYAAEVVKSDFELAGDEDVYKKLTDDFAAANVAITREALAVQFDHWLRVAREQIAAGE